MTVLCLLEAFLANTSVFVSLVYLHAILEHNWGVNSSTTTNIISLTTNWAPPWVLLSSLCWTLLENYFFSSARAWSNTNRCQWKDFQGAQQVRLQTSLQYGSLRQVSLLLSERVVGKAIGNIWSRRCLMVYIFSQNIFFLGDTKDAEHLLWGHTGDIHCFLNT